MRTRLLLVLVGVVAFVLAIHDIPLAGHLRRVEHDRLATKLERDGFILSGRLTEALEAGRAGDDSALLALIGRYAAEEDVRVTVVDAGGVAVLGSDPTVVGADAGAWPEVAEVLRVAEPQTGERFSAELGADVFYVVVPVLSGDSRLGAVQIAAPAAAVSDRVNRQLTGLALVALISLAIAVALAVLFSGSVARPLRRLRVATDQIADGDLAARANADDGPPELRALAGSFNTMAAQMERLVESQRGFAGTASHQLRTPLTALRLRIEQIGDRVGDDSPARAAVDEALAETDRLHRLIEGLLALTRAEHATTEPAEIALTEIVTERVAAWEPLAAEHGVGLVLDAPAAVTVQAVPGAAEQVLDNLIDNALEVAPPGSRLTVRVDALPGTVEVHVIDAGPGLSDADRERAFDRFWRGADAHPGGSGLGLAIARQLLVAGGGDAELRPAPGGGIDAVARFRVTSGVRPPM